MSTLKVNQITDLNDAEIYEPNLMTAQSATGTSVDFTSIPSWVKRITVMFSGVSVSGTSSLLVQLGDSGGIENTGYVSTGVGFAGTSGATLSSTAGFVVFTNNASYTVSGSLSISNLSSNTWVASGSGKITTNILFVAGGDKTLSDTLTQIRITTVNGTDTFDAGTINVMYE
jgi:hypothetical protein